MKARALKTVIKPDYRQFRLRKLNTPEFSHIKLLLFWPVFGLAFLALERFRPHAAYHVMHCALNDAIPFSEWALIPYLLWFVYLIGALAYTFFQDVPAFRRMMRFVIVTYTAATVIYFIYPTQQLLRPEAFAHDNALTRVVAWFYTFDTNTNVCPCSTSLAPPRRCSRCGTARGSGNGRGGRRRPCFWRCASAFPRFS